jgi:hypothetical protein
VRFCALAAPYIPHAAPSPEVGIIKFSDTAARIVRRDLNVEGLACAMFPIASQFVFESAQNKFHIKVSDNERNSRRTQFEIESLLRSSNGKKCESFVTSGGVIEKNSSSHHFSFEQVLIDSHLPKRFSVMMHNIDSHIVPQDPLLRNKFWMRNVRIADDIPGANVMLLFREDRVELKAIKNMNANEELLLWFSEEVISFMGIPFLIPGNIQGEQTSRRCFKELVKCNRITHIHLTAAAASHVITLDLCASVVEVKLS